jgi:hypothetical protein
MREQGRQALRGLGSGGRGGHDEEEDEGDRIRDELERENREGAWLAA